MWEGSKTLCKDHVDCNVCGAASDIGCATCWHCGTSLEDTDGVPQDRSDQPIIGMKARDRQSEDRGMPNPARNKKSPLKTILKKHRMRPSTRITTVDMREMRMRQLEMIKDLSEQQNVIKSLMLTNHGMKISIEKIQEQLKQYLGIR